MNEVVSAKQNQNLVLSIPLDCQACSILFHAIMAVLMPSELICFWQSFERGEMQFVIRLLLLCS